ncbi:hypothetical protein [Streptomyces sp. NPDC003374]
MPKAYVLTRYGGPETEAPAGASPADVAAPGGVRPPRARTAPVPDAGTQPARRGRPAPAVTRTFPRERAGEAPRAVDGGHARGESVTAVVTGVVTGVAG